MKNKNPIRIQRKRTKGWRMPENTVYVGRGSKYGNPFVVGKDGTRDECIEKFIKYFQPYTHREGSMDEFFISLMFYEEVMQDLKGKNLACWCKEGEKCHADYLLNLVN